MKNIIKTFGLLAMTGLALAACSPDDYDGVNEGDVPNIADAKYHVDVNQSTNTVTFYLDEPSKAYPVWTIEGSPVSQTTVSGYQKHYIFKGTYKYTLKLGNRNGVSDGEITDSFTIDTTRYDFTKTIASLTGGGTKEWRIYASKKNHLGCGEPGTEGTNWWAAQPEEKSANSVYDDRITFSNTNDYTYSAGEDGMTFCNKGVTELGVTGAGGDYDTKAVGQFGMQSEAKYALGYNDAFGQETITLPAKTLFPYIAANAQIDGSATFRILSLDDKYMTLALDLPGIVWHFELINGDDPAPSTEVDPSTISWCDPASDLNLGKPLNDLGQMTFWWADANWAQQADPTFSYDNGVYTITAPYATAAQWQAQCSILPQGIALDAGQGYDISVDIDASENFDGATIKICDQADKDNPTLLYKFGSNDGFSLKRGKHTYQWAKYFPKTDGADASAKNVKFIIDLGGCPAGFMAKVSNIIIQKTTAK